MAEIVTAAMVVIGDEILSGKRTDKHLPKVIELLSARGLSLAWAHYVSAEATGDADEAAIKRAWSQRSAETYVLGSAEKIGAASAFEVLPLAAVTAVLQALAPVLG